MLIQIGMLVTLGTTLAAYVSAVLSRYIFIIPEVCFGYVQKKQMLERFGAITFSIHPTEV